jgi:deoxycytidine triphosphate deaminase
VAVLSRIELERGLRQGSYVANPRIIDGEYPDLQNASYDLTAGVAVWRESGKAGIDGTTQTQFCVDPCTEGCQQPTVDLHPGQMMSVITREDLALPLNVCGTVFSKNSIALRGIFAFNAGHVDPGYKGPIIIRLLNLRRTKVTITLGEPLYIIVFEKLDAHVPPGRSPSFSRDQALSAVRHFANDALGNALFELYAGAIEDRLQDHKHSLLSKLRDEFNKTFVTEEKLKRLIWSYIVGAIVAVIALAGAIISAVSRWPDFIKVVSGKP